jgi:hypothetical protein
MRVEISASMALRRSSSEFCAVARDPPEFFTPWM